MVIERIKVTKFRGFENLEFKPGNNITVICGKNGTQKTTLLGLITQPFSINANDAMGGTSPLSGGSYRSAFSDKIRLSPTFDKVGEHEWELDITTNQTNPFIIESINRDLRKGTIRFWKKGKREAGDDYLPIPVIFLSLKRLFPIAESDKLKEDNSVQLDKEEQELFIKWHTDLLNITYDLQAPKIIKGAHKDSAGVEADHYDWNLNSAGQDNLSKILLAILSFRRLKKQFKTDYKGGILAIDEIDTTLHASTLIKLFRILRKASSELNIQVFFTTHSLFLLNEVSQKIDENNKKETTKNQIELIYLETVDKKVKIVPDISIESIENRIKEELSPKIIKRKIRVFTEDNEAIIFTKALLKSRASKLDFIKVPMPCSSLIELVSKKLPMFKFGDSITILDGDVSADAKDIAKIKSRNLKNILLLPGTLSPEGLLSKYLWDLSDANPLWSSIHSDYSKSICFKNHKNKDIQDKRDSAKKWFKEQLSHWGSNATKVMKYWIKDNKVEVDKFIAEFDVLMGKMG
jgi:hypothetical protein